MICCLPLTSLTSSSLPPCMLLHKLHWPLCFFSWKSYLGVFIHFISSAWNCHFQDGHVGSSPLSSGFYLKVTFLPRTFLAILTKISPNLSISQHFLSSLPTLTCYFLALHLSACSVNCLPHWNVSFTKVRIFLCFLTTLTTLHPATTTAPGPHEIHNKYLLKTEWFHSFSQKIFILHLLKARHYAGHL